MHLKFDTPNGVEEMVLCFYRFCSHKVAISIDMLADTSSRRYNIMILL